MLTCIVGVLWVARRRHWLSPRRLFCGDGSTRGTVSCNGGDCFASFKELCSRGCIKEAFARHSNEVWADPPLFSLLLQSCIPNKLLRLGKQLHSLVVVSGCFRDKFVRNHLLNMYSKMGELEVAVALFDAMPKRNVMSGNILINAHLQSGDVEGAYDVFDKMRERNVATWNAIIAGMAQLEFNEGALCLFGEMHRSCCEPDEFTVASVLKGCAGLRNGRAGRQVHALVAKRGLELDLIVASSLAHMYIKSGNLEQGEEVVESMAIIPLGAWNTLIAGKAQNGHFESVMHLYNSMTSAGMMPDEITFVSLISSCSELATLCQGQQIHAQLTKAGINSDVAVTSSLISMYSRCGCLEQSARAFAESRDADVVSWSCMISAYGLHGRGGEAIELFELMEKKGNMEANEVTFLCLLDACSHSGLKQRGLELLELMENKYGLNPNLRHYTCVVDLLGRSGCLDEAEEKIRSMPVEPDSIIWKTLLWACVAHKEEAIARRAAEQILRLDPQDPVPFVLLSGIHASAKRWRHVSNVRTVMRDRKVKKEPGVSWVEVQNQVHQFRVADKSHPRTKEIYLYLDQLSTEMELCDYVTDL